MYQDPLGNHAVVAPRAHNSLQLRGAARPSKSRIYLSVTLLHNRIDTMLMTLPDLRRSHSLVKPGSCQRTDGSGTILVRRQEPQQRQRGRGRDGAWLDPSVSSCIYCRIVAVKQPQFRLVDHGSFLAWTRDPLLVCLKRASERMRDQGYHQGWEEERQWVACARSFVQHVTSHGGDE